MVLLREISCTAQWHNNLIERLCWISSRVKAILFFLHLADQLLNKLTFDARGNIYCRTCDIIFIMFRVSFVEYLLFKLSFFLQVTIKYPFLHCWHSSWLNTDFTKITRKMPKIFVINCQYLVQKVKVIVISPYSILPLV